jgi:hypothetical protein
VFTAENTEGAEGVVEFTAEFAGVSWSSATELAEFAEGTKSEYAPNSPLSASSAVPTPRGRQAKRPERGGFAV